MILMFDPPKELVDFVFDAARAACEIVPGVTALQVIGPHASKKVGKARAICAALIQKRVWLEARPGEEGYGHGGTLRMAISLGKTNPFPEMPHPTSISTTMVGWLIGRCHTSIVKSRARAKPEEIRRADAILLDGYAAGETIMGTVFLKGYRERIQVVG